MPEFFDSVTQYLVVLESIDYFSQFSWGDDIFERYMLMFLLLEKAELEVGEGLVYESHAGDELTRVERALLGETIEGDREWSLSISTSTQNIYVEMLAAKSGIPLRIRYAHPIMGGVHEREPMLSLGYRDAVKQYGEELIQESVFEIVASDIDRFRRQISHPRLTGEESVTTPAGTFDSLHYADAAGDAIAEYWFETGAANGAATAAATGAPTDETARFLKLEVSPASGEVLLSVEYVARTNGNASRFDGEKIVPDSPVAFFDDDFSDSMTEDPTSSDGSVEEPIYIDTGTSYAGGVANGETSYYAFYVTKRSDVEVSVTHSSGRVELVYFADDWGFSDWVTSSSGPEPDIQDYYLDTHSIGYFTITDMDEDDGLGAAYTISVDSHFILDNIGISIRGDIIDSANEIEPGTSTIAALGSDALHYYRTVVPKGGALRVIASGLPDGAGLRWFDTTAGSYSGAYRSASTESEILEVTGLSEEGICFYYIAGEPDSEHADVEFSLQVEVHTP